MTLVLDTGPLIAFADQADRWHGPVRRLIQEERGALIIPAPVSAEVDYLLGKRLGRLARLAFLRDVSFGRFQVECLDAIEYDLLHSIDEDYADLDVGLADLSVVILAHRFGTTRIATFDERHFRTLRTVTGTNFTVLPQDDS